jgi:hypothetical protein
MASSAGNNGELIRFEDGGVFRVWNAAGTDDIALDFIGPGTLRWSEGQRARLPVYDRGVIAAIKAGDVIPSEIDLDCMVTDDVNDFFAALELGVDSDGLIVTYRVDIELRKDRNATVGPRRTWAACYLREPVTFSAGGTNAAGGDTMSIRLASVAAAPTRDLWS